MSNTLTNNQINSLKDAINDIDILADKIALQVDEDYFRASADGEFGDVFFFKQKTAYEITV